MALSESIADLQRDAVWKPIWVGGRDYHPDMTGEYVPGWSWSYGATLAPPFAGGGQGDHTRMQLELRANPVKDYGRGRRVYRWRLRARMGAVDFPVADGRSYGLAAMLRDATAAMDCEAIRERLWQAACERAVTYCDAHTGEPLFCQLGCFWLVTGRTPRGRYVIRRQDGLPYYIEHSGYGSAAGSSKPHFNWDFEPARPQA